MELYPGRLLVESNNGKWAFYNRHPRLVPSPIRFYAKTIYDLTERKYYKGNSLLPMYIDGLPLATHVLAYNKFVAGILFDGEYIGVTPT